MAKVKVVNSYLRLAGLIILAFGVVAGITLIGRVQEVREKAAVPQGEASVFLNPTSGSYNVGDIIATGVYFNTGNIAISGIALRLKYSFTGTEPEVKVASIDINKTFLTSGDWTCPTKTTTQIADEVVIDIACANITALGFTSSANTHLATINLYVQSPPDGELTLRFDPQYSEITEKSTNQDILSIPTSFTSFVVVQTGPVLFFIPPEIDVPTNSTNMAHDIYLDTRGYEVNGAVFEIKFDTNVIAIRDVIEGNILRLVIDKSVEAGTAYLSVVLADKTKPFVGMGKVATVLFDTFSTATTTYFTFEKNTQIHTKALTSNILGKALKGTIHIGLPQTPTPTATITPTTTPSPTIPPTFTPTEMPTPMPTPCIKIGDANGDCKVDGVDFVIWLIHFRQTTDKGPAEGDFNNDGIVDGKDYGLWFLNLEV